MSHTEPKTGSLGFLGCKAMSKRKREDDGVDDAGETSEGGVDEALLEALESAEAVEVLDLRSVKKMVLSFERKLRDNLEARMKYAEQPDKFVESEVDLDEELKKMHALAATPDLYPEIVKLKLVPSILSLLSHDNTDISIDVVDLLKELTDENTIADSEEPALVLVEDLVENNALELLVQNISRLNEELPDEAAAVFNTLSIIENMVELKQTVVEQVGERTKFLKWLLTRIRVKEFDSNKLYATEILAILLQSSSANQSRVGELDGIDTLLQAISVYKASDPQPGDEEEMLENLFDCLCSAVMHPSNHEKFVQAEGVELMIIIMKQKKMAYASAVRALDFALTNCSAACERFVQVEGLKVLLPAFMGKLPKHRKGRSADEIEQRIISLTCSLFGGLTRPKYREILLDKFTERECEKLDRLMEFFVRYTNRVKAETKRLDEEQLEDVELDEDERYLRKLDAGLFTLQLLALTLAYLWSSERSVIRDRIVLLLKQQRLTRDEFKAILQEYHDNIGDVDGVDERDKRRAKVQALISSL